MAAALARAVYMKALAAAEEEKGERRRDRREKGDRKGQLGSGFGCVRRGTCGTGGRLNGTDVRERKRAGALDDGRETRVCVDV